MSISDFVSLATSIRADAEYMFASEPQKPKDFSLDSRAGPYMGLKDSSSEATASPFLAKRCRYGANLVGKGMSGSL